MICNEIVSWASTYWSTLKQSSKTCSAGRHTLRYSKTELQTMICDKIVSWVSTCWGTLKQSLKTCSASWKTPRYGQNRAINNDLRRHCLLVTNVSKYTETVLENVLSVSKNLQVQSNCATDDIVSWVSTCWGTLKQFSKTCSAGRKTPWYTQIREQVIF